VLASIGRLSAQTLALKTATYNPKVHYDQVRDKWIGTTTPDGR
jgi:outer membrane protein